MKYLSGFTALLSLTLCAVFTPAYGSDSAKSTETVVKAGNLHVSSIPYKTYKNERFGYQLNYPPELLVPQGESDNGDGQKFLSKQGDAEMSVWGNYKVAGDLNYERKLANEPEGKGQPQRKVTYEAGGKDWFAISGTAGDKIFYQKTCLRADTFRTVTFSYAQSAKEKFAQVIDNVVGTFRWTHK